MSYTRIIKRIHSTLSSKYKKKKTPYVLFVPCLTKFHYTFLVQNQFFVVATQSILRFFSNVLLSVVIVFPVVFENLGYIGVSPLQVGPNVGCVFFVFDIVFPSIWPHTSCPNQKKKNDSLTTYKFFFSLTNISSSSPTVQKTVACLFRGI